MTDTPTPNLPSPSVLDAATAAEVLLPAHGWRQGPDGDWTQPPDHPDQMPWPEALLTLADDLAHQVPSPDATPADLLAALVTAQAHVEGVRKTGRNTSQGYAFVTVEDVTRACRAALTAAGLVAVYRLRPTSDPDPAHLDAELFVAHPASGQTLTLPMPWPVERPGPQARRAAFSYGRKQALVELLLVAEPDDPETSADHPHETEATPPPAARGARGPQPMTDPQRRAIWATARKAGYGDVADLAVFAAGLFDADLSTTTADELLGSLTRAEASALIEALDKAATASRDQPTEPDPHDPWAVDAEKADQ